MSSLLHRSADGRCKTTNMMDTATEIVFFTERGWKRFVFRLVIAPDCWRRYQFTLASRSSDLELFGVGARSLERRRGCSRGRRSTVRRPIQEQIASHLSPRRLARFVICSGSWREALMISIGLQEFSRYFGGHIAKLIRMSAPTSTHHRSTALRRPHRSGEGRVGKVIAVEAERNVVRHRGPCAFGKRRGIEDKQE